MKSNSTAVQITATLLALVCSTQFTATALADGRVIFNLVIDPASTAFAGVPASGGFVGTSNRSGPGTWQLFALDDLTDSFGLSHFLVQLNNVTSISNRSPKTSYDNEYDDSPRAGFTTIRSQTNQNPLSGVMDLPFSQPYTVGGMGQTAGNFSTIPNAVSFYDTVNGQWGNYATVSPYDLRRWVFLGEGSYSGAAPKIDYSNTFGGSYRNSGLTTIATANVASFCVGCPAPVFTSPSEIDNATASNPDLAHTFAATNTTGWSNIGLLSYTPGYGAPGGGPANYPTLDPVTHRFDWNTIGSTLGTYVWRVWAYGDYGATIGDLTIHITAIPEPGAFSLVVLAAAGCLSYARRRRV